MMKKLLCLLCAALLLFSCAPAEGANDQLSQIYDDDLALYFDMIRLSFLPLEEQLALLGPSACSLPGENDMQQADVLAAALTFLANEYGEETAVLAASMPVGSRCSDVAYWDGTQVKRWEIFYVDDPSAITTGWRVLIDYAANTHLHLLYQANDIMDNSNG